MNYYKYNNLKFIIFSDDIEWCKHKFNGTDVQFSTGNSSIIDFAMMSLCDHHILTRSSFSWWAAWLSKNENKICISPPENMTMSLNRDIIPDDWIRI